VPTTKKPRLTATAQRRRLFAIMKKTCGHAHFATVDRGQPWVRSISPIVDKDLSIWIATFASSRKVGHIRSNPKVCLEFVSQPDGDQAAVVVGVARVVRDRSEKEAAWKLAPYDLATYFPDGPGSRDYCLLRIVPAEIRWRESWAGGTKVYRPKSGSGRRPSRA